MKTIFCTLFFFSNIVIGQTDSISTLISSKINHLSESPVHSILLYIENDDFNYNEGFGLIDREGGSVSKNSPFRIASSTKLFVSTIILQLQEEGKLNINDEAFQYLNDIEYLKFKDFHILNGKNHAKEITVEQLLSHRSGLGDIYTDREEDFFNLVIQNPAKQYSPKALIDLYYQFNLNNEPYFKPNGGWNYSDINYLLLGLLIEKIDQKSLSKSIRNRILTPLNMKNTYLEFYEEPIKNNKMIHQYVGSVNFSDINTSFDWSGGGLVSTNKDLAVFIKSLFNLKLINQKSLNIMIDVKFTKNNESRYGLGIYEFVVNGNKFYGHFGFYGTFIGYSPKIKTTLSYSISQTTPSFNSYQFLSQLLTYIKG